MSEVSSGVQSSTPRQVGQPDDGGSGTLGDFPGETGTAVASGQRVGRYWLLEPLGHGGMGVVYLGYDPELHRKVAVKLLHDDPTGGIASPRRLLREAQALAQLSHRNLVHVYDVGTVEGRVFIAMELIEGRSLARWLRDRPPWRRVVSVFRDAGRGLMAAHAAGIVHRDFKPGNVVLGDDGVVRVLDFGLARVRVGVDDASHSASGSVESMPIPRELAAEFDDEDEPLTMGVVLGTPAYMAPEQHSGGKATVLSDQYSFCLALYEALYGERPFPKTTIRELARRKRKGKLRPAPAGIRIPGWLRRVVLKGLSPDPAQRHRSLAMLLDRLEVTSAATKARWVLAAGGAAVVGVSAWSLAQKESPPPPVCERVGEALDGVWNSSRASRIAIAFEATELSYAAGTWRRLEPVITRYAAGWRAMRGEVCRATHLDGSQSDAMLDLRMACLDRRRDELDAVLDLYETPTVGLVQRAADAVAGLSSVGPCADTEALTAAVPLPETQDARRALATAQRWLAEAEALDAAGRHTQAEARARAAVAEGLRIGYRPLLAEAKLVLASSLDNEPAAAEAAVREAIEIAAEIGADALERAGLRRLLFEVGIRRGRLQEAGGIAFAARAAWLRAGLEPEGDASLQADLGLLAAARGDTDEARVCFERSLKALEAEDASLARRLVVVAGYAAALMQQGAWDDASGAFLRVRRLGIETYGPRHPFVADTELNLGQIAGQLGDAATANGHFEAALEILEAAADQHGERLALAYAAYAAIALVEGRTVAARTRARRALALLAGIDDAAPLSASVYDVLGTAASFEGRYDLAVGEHRRALQRATTGFGAASPNEAVARAHLADSLALRGQWREARRELDIATPTVVKVFGSEGPHYAEVLVTDSVLLRLEGGRPHAAREAAERALALLPAGQAVMVARAHFVLAQAMLAADDRSGAERESGLARKSLTDLNLLALAHEIEAWRAASHLGV